MFFCEGYKGTPIVARGFKKKEDETITSDSPTCLQESVHIFLLVAVSNGLMLDQLIQNVQGYNFDRNIYKSTTGG